MVTKVFEPLKFDCVLALITTFSWSYDVSDFCYNASATSASSTKAVLAYHLFDLLYIIISISDA